MSTIFRLTLSILCCFALAASADLAPPNVGQCSNAKVGDKCELDGGGNGTCEKKKCSKWSYQTDKDGGMKRVRIEVDCLKCVPAADAKPAPNTPKRNEASWNGTTKAAAATGGLLLFALGMWANRRRDDEPVA